MEERGKPIELRSEELQDILGKTPPWILRSGLVLIGIVVVLLLAASWFFKYPEVVTAPMVLTGTKPPAGVVAKTNGRLMLIHVKDNQQVEVNQVLAIIENPASSDDMALLKQYVEKLLENTQNIRTIGALSKKELELGNVQQYFQAFSRSLDNYERFRKINYYPQKIDAIKERIEASEDYRDKIKRQTKILEQQYAIAGKHFNRDSALYHSEVISGTEMDNARNQYLQNKLGVEGSYSSLDNMQIQIKQTRESLLDAEQQYTDQLIALESDINNQAVQLLNEIKTWEMTYLLTSPIDGTVTFNSYWSENQNIKLGEVVFTVVPKEEGELLGKALLPMERSGKVKVGQMVNVRFLNFPENEFGKVRGVIKNISQVPIDGKYTVQIAFPNRLETTYKKILPFTQEMQAQADIITEDLRLLERVMMPIKKIFYDSVQK